MRIAKFMLASSMLAMLLNSTAVQGADRKSASDERASAFAAGRQSPDEAFGRLEGQILFGTAVLATLVLFTLMFVEMRKNNHIRSRLASVERLLERTRGDET